VSRELRFFWNADESAYPPEFMAGARIDYHKIDTGIAELVSKINGTTWAETIMSCEGHTEKDDPYSPTPEIWLRVFDGEGLLRLYDWLARAIKVRQATSTCYKSSKIIDLEFVGKTRHGYFFCLYATKFVSAIENRRIIDALTETL